MVKRIFMVEDDKDLLIQAAGPLARAGYEMVQVDLERANNLEYWKQQQITREDVVGLDLNLKLAGVNYSGLDVFKTLQRGKETGQLPNLERVLIQTSVRGQVSPQSVNPDLALAEEFAVSGYEKAVNPTTRQVDPASYGKDLILTLDNLYARRNLLNE